MDFHEIKLHYTDFPSNKPLMSIILQGGAPPVISWFINHRNSIDIPTINHSEIEIMCTNLANELGHHLVPSGNDGLSSPRRSTKESFRNRNG